MLPLIAEHKKTHMKTYKPLPKNPLVQRMEDMQIPGSVKKTKAMYEWDKALEESRQGLEDQRCKSCRVYPGSSHKENCSELLRIRTKAYKEYKRKSEAPHTREYLRPISDPHHGRHVFMVLVLIVAVVIAVVVL